MLDTVHLTFWCTGFFDFFEQGWILFWGSIKSLEIGWMLSRSALKQLLGKSSATFSLGLIGPIAKGKEF